MLRPCSLHAKVRNFIDSCKRLFGHHPKNTSIVSDLYSNVKDTDNFALFHLSSETKLNSRSRNQLNYYGYKCPFSVNKKTPSSVEFHPDTRQCLAQNNTQNNTKEISPISRNLWPRKVSPSSDLENQRLTRSRIKHVTSNPLAVVHEKLNKSRKMRSKGCQVSKYFMREAERTAKTRWLETIEFFSKKCRQDGSAACYNCFSC